MKSNKSDLEKIKTGLKKNVDMAISFAISIIIFLGVMMVLHISPFGERSLNNLDLYHQYLPIMAELQRIIHDGGSIFYSFKAGLGTNFYSLSTFQNASPITWIFLAIFREDNIVACAISLILFKIGLISASMNWYLRDSSPSDGCDKAGAGRGTAREIQTTCESGDRIIKIVLAVLFALSGYVIGYYTTLMWLDAMILTPFCIAGLKRCIDRKGDALYIISLALLLFTNYYIGAQVCIFIVLYFFAHFFGERKKGVVKVAARTCGISLISVLMSMVVLMPTAIALRKTEHFATIGSGFSNWFRQSIPDHVAQLLPASNVTIMDGPPNLYAGLICLVLLALYALQKDIDKRKKAIRLSLIAFVFVSTNIIPLDLIWHFMHTPWMFPARYSFLLAFLLIETAAETLERAGTFEKKDIVKSFIFVALLYVIAIPGNEWDGMDKRFMYAIGAVLIVLYAFVLLVMRSESGQIRKGILVAVIMFEIVTATFRGIGAGNIADADKYRLHGEDVSELIKIAEEKTPNCRIEVLGESTNDSIRPYVYGYKGVSIFASSVPKSTYDILKESFPGGGIGTNIFLYESVDAKNDSLFGIRYYISIDGEMKDHPELKEVSRSGECFLYENPHHGSIGYMISEAVLSSGASGKSGKTAGGDLPASKLCDIANEKGFNTDVQLDISRMEGNRLTGSIDAPDDGVLLITIPCDEGWQVKLDGNSIKNYEAVPGFISFEVEKGAHKVDMKFIPPGFTAGALLSMLGVVVFLIKNLFITKLRRRSE